VLSLRIAAALLGAIAALGVIASPIASARTGGEIVVTATQIGPLHLDRARRAAVRRFFGRPKVADRGGLHYRCSRRGCRINYLFRSSRPDRGRLDAFVAGTGARFRTANGTRIGMSAAEARRREPGALSTDMCGRIPVLRYPARASAPGAVAGLNIVLLKGKVAAFDVFSVHAKVSCARGGFIVHG
jgi:hypothetical protein